MRTIIPAAPGYRAYRLSGAIGECADLHEEDFYDVLAWLIDEYTDCEGNDGRILVTPITLYDNGSNVDFLPIIITPRGTVEFDCNIFYSLDTFMKWVRYVIEKKNNPA